MTRLEQEQAKVIERLRYLLKLANSRVSTQRRRAEMWRIRAQQRDKK